MITVARPAIHTSRCSAEIDVLSGIIGLICSFAERTNCSSETSVMPPDEAIMQPLLSVDKFSAAPTRACA
jgi:hypothetical protein